MNPIEQTVRDRLFALADLGYRDFHAKLMPTVEKDRIIGVRTPALRAFAIEFSKTEEAAEFFRILPHRYYEEDNLHGFLIERIGEYAPTVAALDRFLPYVDNWATCDLMSPKVFGKHRPQILEKLRADWLYSPHTYTCRYAIGILMRHFLRDAFTPEIPELVTSVRSEEYYVRMMIAWFFASALCDRYDETIPYLTGRRLDPWTHNKSIQKAIESRQVSDETKAYLRTLRVKG
jgi:3-methyladenine DNA glycosylase AlkD